MIISFLKNLAIHSVPAHCAYKSKPWFYPFSGGLKKGLGGSKELAGKIFVFYTPLGSYKPKIRKWTQKSSGGWFFWHFDMHYWDNSSGARREALKGKCCPFLY